MKVVVASQNPVKKEAVFNGFSAYFPAIEMVTMEVESGVSDQPFTDEETKKGARNRAENARKLTQEADFWVGIEGGIQAVDTGLTAFDG